MSAFGAHEKKMKSDFTQLKIEMNEVGLHSAED